MRRNALVATATLAGLLALATLTGCSREKIDWKSAEAADSVEGYDHFIERHPDSALVTQARTRVAQLNEDRDWKRATATDTADAYQQFLAQHESGKWAEEARIRVENFALDGTATGPAQPAAAESAPVVASAPAAASAAAATPVAPSSGATHGLRNAVSTAAPSAAGAPSATAVPTAAAKIASPPKSTAEPKPASAGKPAPEAKHLAAATPPATKPAAPAATPASSFGIQLGAFRSQDAALKNWKQLQVKYDADLHGLFAHAVPVKQTSGQLFRLQAPVGEEARARAICASLSKQSQPCVVVLPQP